MRCTVCYSADIVKFECDGNTTNPLEVCYGKVSKHTHYSCNECCHEWVKENKDV